VYQVSYTGMPCAIAGVASTATSSNFKYDATMKTTTCEITVPDSDDQLMLSFTNTSGGIRQLSIIRPGYTSKDMFTKPFLTQLQRFAGPFRFMDWGSTNNSPVTDWASSAKPTDAQWTKKGIPWEACIALCNLLQKDIWVNIPHMADDDYVKQLAILLEASLNKNLNVYVEYSNEVWNWQFQQAHWNLAAAQTEVQAGKSPLNYTGDTNIYYWGWRRVALRLYQISNIFSNVWGAAAINTRVRPVLAGQVVQALVAQEGLDMIQAVYGPPSKYFYAIAGAPYFSFHDVDDKNPNLSVDDVLNYLNASIQEIKNAKYMTDNAQLAAKYKLKFFSYEGGPDTFGPNNIQAKKKASEDPRMESLCYEYLSNWFGDGYGVFNWFVAGASSYDSQYGTWALTEDPAVLDTPKLRAINKILGV